MTGRVEALSAEACPVCASTDVIRLSDDWQEQVYKTGFAIPIIGCGNPWHYATLAAARQSPPLDVERLAEAIRAHAAGHQTRSRTHITPSCAKKVAAEYARLAGKGERAARGQGNVE